jgi:hypothetical protein
MDNPQELIQILVDAGLEELDRSVVDRFLACGQACVDPLVEFIRTSDDDPALARALILLGEIGDPSLLEMLTLHFVDDEEEEDAVSDMANWAFQRLIVRHPAEALAEIRRLAGEGSSFLINDLSKHLALAEGVPGRTETLLSLANRISDPDLDADDRDAVVSAVLTTAMVMEGPDGALTKSLRSEYGRHLSRDSERILREVHTEIRKHSGPSEPAPDVYEVFCPALIEEPAGPYVRPEPKVGRNDPCWCGSGKKYKKCHLETDEAE